MYSKLESISLIHRAIALAGAVLVAVTFSAPARAAEFVVTSSGDGGDASPGNGTCSTSLVFAVCTLRAAIEESNALAGSDVIFIGSRTIAVSPQLFITDDVILLGDGARETVIRPEPSHRAINIEPSASVSLFNLKIEGARAGLHASGGAVRNAGHLHAEGVWFHDNEGINCGALLDHGALGTTVDDSTFSNNRAVAGGDGGAVCLTFHSDALFHNTTFFGNSAVRGAALFVSGPPTEVSLFSTTIASNSDVDPQFPPTSSALYVEAGAVQINQSVIEGTCVYVEGFATNSTWTNLEGPGASCLSGSTNDHSILTAAQLGLGEPADRGGPMPTMLPQTTSMAVDPFVDAGPFCSNEDARGLPRHGSCDVGAVERQPGEPESGPIFVDGFESGNTGVWSSVSP